MPVVFIRKSLLRAERHPPIRVEHCASVSLGKRSVRKLSMIDYTRIWGSSRSQLPSRYHAYLGTLYFCLSQQELMSSFWNRVHVILWAKGNFEATERLEL